ncbi:hypothetical protein KIL84_004998 [Mauremys mutica]|uniref:Uncharacterized protein n=1 Tax=Mauremys mutica TaxID=74926 RepID=A0A9D4AYI7_9SAUR|nr:hypothetical protein KIL84_004998 [Mauremys mutica]
MRSALAEASVTPSAEHFEQSHMAETKAWIIVVGSILKKKNHNLLTQCKMLVSITTTSASIGCWESKRTRRLYNPLLKRGTLARERADCTLSDSRTAFPCHLCLFGLNFRAFVVCNVVVVLVPGIREREIGESFLSYKSLSW